MVQIPLVRHRYTKWTPARAAELTRLWNDGGRVADIAATLGVTLKAVYKKVWLMRHIQRMQDVTKRRAGRPRKEQT